MGWKFLHRLKGTNWSTFCPKNESYIFKLGLLGANDLWILLAIYQLTSVDISVCCIEVYIFQVISLKKAWFS